MRNKDGNPPPPLPKKPKQIKKKHIFFLSNWGEKHNFWHWKWGWISGPKLSDQEPCFNMKEINWSLCESSENQEHISSVSLEGIKDFFLFQHVREPTRFREGQIPSVLDLILTNEENMVEKIDYLPSLGKSDHVVLGFNFNCFIEKVLSSQKVQL